jgi:hypothetical protein
VQGAAGLGGCDEFVCMAPGGLDELYAHGG